ncbi:MAG: radical SAM family heme chaperone HemW [Anaerolineaceae bacterium]|nr:radical SAM family heme chaperone HemW [Anaerolineaceae bacterium]
MNSIQYSLYLHIPFCVHRCSYCDFNTYAGHQRFMPAYVEALCREIRGVAAQAPGRLPVHTVFFGGGTPSLLASADVGTILDALRDGYDIQPDAEITLEANPGTLSPQFLVELRMIGVNRLSMGMQSAHPDDLRLLERQHSYLEVIQSVEWARKAGFENLNLDLIFGIPEQPLARWRENLELALGLNPEHLSLYALTLEHGTPFQRWTERGLIPEADTDLTADMYDLAEVRLAKAGYVHYEISNWAQSDLHGGYRSCRHNLQYWRGQPYLGFGAGAHGFANRFRTENVHGIRQYINQMQRNWGSEFPISPAIVTVTPIDALTEMQETMMVGLRLTEEGVSASNFKLRFGRELIEVFGQEIDKLERDGLLEWIGAESDRLRLTLRGHLLGNRVFREFV